MMNLCSICRHGSQRGIGVPVNSALPGGKRCRELSGNGHLVKCNVYTSADVQEGVEQM